MELMDRDALSLTEEETVHIRLQVRISEPDGALLFFRGPGEKGSHGIMLSVSAFHFLLQKHHPAAFGDTGHAGRERVPDGCFHGKVPGKLRRKELRVSSRKDHAAASVRQHAVMERAETDRLRAEVPEKIQGFFIEEAESFVFCHRDADRRFARQKGCSGRQNWCFGLSLQGSFFFITCRKEFT